MGTIIFPRSKHIDQCLSLLRSDQTAVRTLFAKGLKIRIVPIAITMCQVPPIDSQEAPSSSRGGNTSISASSVPIEPAVRTLFAKGLKIRIVPIAISMCQVPSIDSQEASSSSRDGNTSISASPIPIGPAVRTLFAKRLKIRSVPIGMCQVPQMDYR